jgi:epoxide hydrolase 4
MSLSTGANQGMRTSTHTFTAALPDGIELACRANFAAGVPALAPPGSPGATAPRVVLLHGFPEAAFVWDEVMHLLAPQARCLAPNLRGYAGSSAPAEVAAYRPKHLVADVVALIEKFGAPLDLLVAHDWGGALAWNLAAARPDLLKRLLIINSPHPATFLRELRHNAAQQAASRYMNFLCRPDAEALLVENSHARLWPFLGSANWLTEAVRAQYRAVWTADGAGLKGPLNYYRASPLRPATSATDLLHTLVLPDDSVTVRVPTTVLWAEDDVALLPGLLDGLEKWVPQMDLRRVPQATHWVVHEQPGLIAQTVRGLIQAD